MKRTIKYRTITDKLYAGIVYFFAVVALLPFLWIAFELLRKGLPRISFEFFTQSWPGALRSILLSSSGDPVVGGIANALIGSFQIIILGVLMAFPIGLVVGVYMFENEGRKFFKAVKLSAELLHGTPSIIIGVVAYFWITMNLHSFSALAGAVALAIIMFPTIARYSYTALKQDASAIKEAGIALGGSNFQVLIRVLLATSLRGILSGAFRAIANSFGKISPLLFTVLGASMVNWSIKDASSSLPWILWNNYELTHLSELLWPAMLTLCVPVFLFNFLAGIIQKPKTNK